MSTEYHHGGWRGFFLWYVGVLVVLKILWGHESLDRLTALAFPVALFCWAAFTWEKQP